MKQFDRLAVRLTGMIFILLVLTITVLLLLVNDQMSHHFSQYLQMYPRNGVGGHHMMRGFAEQQYISSIHESLIAVGIGMVVVSVVFSFFIIQKAVQPLVTLTEAVKTVEKGKFGQTVVVDRHDEVGVLAQTFNAMSIQLAQNEEMRQHLFASIAHELRTPLAIIQGNLEGMIDDVIPVNKKMFLSMEDEVLRLGRLVQDLNDLSLAEIGQLTLHKKEAQVNVMLEHAVSMLQPLCDEKHLTITMDLCPDLPVICIDTDRINQVIYNILNNAIRYIRNDDQIIITTAAEVRGNTNCISMSFADTGNGIAPEDLPYIFQYFYRGEKSRSRQGGGSGIGLALAQQFVHCHGGTIDVKSVVGEGTVFTVYLPILPQ